MMTKSDIFFFIREAPYGFLSNLWRAQQVVDGIFYDCNERYYQCQKTGSAKILAWIFTAPSPYLAMSVGHSLRIKHRVPDGLEIRPDWTKSTRLLTMLKGLRAKFTQNQDLAALLLATGDDSLHENNGYDRFWGVGEPDAPIIAKKLDEQGLAYTPKGEDNLGKLLMQVRDELKSAGDDE